MNFVWVYGSEAHPEENPFQEGYESCDLGWEHPYSITTSMEERAQRARWLKTDPDPDFEIPMIIDYINTELGPDNAIRAAYHGGWFYSSAVIDCDGIIIDERPWAWYDDGGDWWDLPLAHIDNLYALLDEYLADPPECFYGYSGDADADTDTDADGDGEAGGGGDSGGCSTLSVATGSASSGLIELVFSVI